ncbi:MAG: type II toxin-antitoxin system RelE/ParE family toxin [Geothrix sp.]|nr:type II toxin-antitoxin system RelE/ParE family toxin [Geothrix sp.]
MAALKIQFTSRARRDLREVLGYIAQDNPEAASSLAERLAGALEHKAQFPQSGRAIPEAPEHQAQELVFPPCRIFYVTDATTLTVLSLMRSERLFRPEALSD